MAFKMKGSPAKLGTINGTAGHASALKHIRSEGKRPGHNKKYHATDPSNDAHGEYWKDGSKEEEIAAAAGGETKTTTNETKAEDNTNATSTGDNTKTTKKRNFLQKIGDKLKEGHKVRKKTDADYKANKKSGESKHQYNVRKRRENMQVAKKEEETPSKMKGSPAKQKLDGKPSVQEQKLHDALVTGKKSKTKKEAEEFGKNIKKKIKAYKK